MTADEQATPSPAQPTEGIASVCREKGHAGCERRSLDGELWTIHHPAPSPVQSADVKSHDSGSAS